MAELHCLQCGKKLTGRQTKFCRRRCTMIWQHVNNPLFREAVIAAARATQRERQPRAVKAAQKKWKTDKKFRTKEVKRMRAAMSERQRVFVFRDRIGRDWAMRSSLEVSYAKILDSQNLTWFYEPPAKALSNGSRYTPDFWVEQWETYVEVGGGFSKVKNKKRTDRFIADGFPLLVVSRREVLEAV